MGGLAFNKTAPGKSRRYSRGEYLSVEHYLSHRVFPNLFSKFEVCPYLYSKQDFGDMDVIVIPSVELNIDLLKDWFNTEYVIHNGDTWSLIFEELQIDLIVSNAEEYDFHRAYLGLYDRGNFVGKIAHMLGLKFGHNGLWLPIRFNDSHKLKDIRLTLDVTKAEEFLDIKHLVNPRTIEDVFDNVIASKYFNPEVFALENNNQVARIRDKKRPSYRTFLEYIKTLPDRDYFPRSTGNKLQFLPMIFEAFPDAEVEYKALYAYKEKMDLFKEKFNGDIVSNITGFTGKELGEFMVMFKSKYSVDRILGMTKQQLWLLVQDQMEINLHKDFRLLKYFHGPQQTGN